MSSNLIFKSFNFKLKKNKKTLQQYLDKIVKTNDPKFIASFKTNFDYDYDNIIKKT